MIGNITFFPVGNGDMTLIELENGKTILIDVRIRSEADNDSNNDVPDVVSSLKEKLKKDDDGRYYVDVFLLSHPDEDHCLGLDKNFHLGSLDEYNADSDKIIIYEIWSSPLTFRRQKTDHKLCSDAIAFRKEAKRRVSIYRDKKDDFVDGNKVLLLGHDERNQETGRYKTEDLSEILIEIDKSFSRICGEDQDSFSVRLLGPLPFSDKKEEEEELSKNNSSVIMQWAFKVQGVEKACLFLTGGDAEVTIWKKMWERHGARQPDWLSYDILQAPHHCSWHSLSYDSWSEKGNDAEVNKEAKQALSQINEGGFIIASSKPINDDKNDPPCIGAKREYLGIIDEVGKGEFICVADKREPLKFLLNKNGPIKDTKTKVANISGNPIPHG